MSQSRVESPRPEVASVSDDLGSETPATPSYECDACGRSFEGPPGGSGLLVWTRGTEVRYEEPPLCDKCASKITIGALMKWYVDEEEEG